MKNLTLITIALIALSAKVSAQIINSGFENWTTVGAYMEPQGYLTPNATAGTPYPVQQSTDHYPSSIGNFSLRLENNISLLPNDGYGVVLQSTSGAMNNGPGPFFPIVGHPTSLTGYYKFSPQNGDSLNIVIQLYSNGITVAGGQLISNASQVNWTSFNIPISNYTVADSGSILIAAYNADGPPPAFAPHGNSVLYVDNLNFDNLLTVGISDITESTKQSVFPNPFSEQLYVDISDNEESELILYDIFSRKISQKTFTKSGSFNTQQLTNGIYFYELKQGKVTIKSGNLIKQ